MERFTVAAIAALFGLVVATASHATLNACLAAKKQCVAKRAAAILKCQSQNEKPPGVMPAKFAACVQKAKDKFDGGGDPAKGCFAKVEAKFGSECLTTEDTATVAGQVDAFVEDVACGLDASACPTPTATPTPSPTVTPCVPTCPECVRFSISDGCGGTCAPNCAFNCCGPPQGCTSGPCF